MLLIIEVVYMKNGWYYEIFCVILFLSVFDLYKYGCFS